MEYDADGCCDESPEIDASVGAKLVENLLEEVLAELLVVHKSNSKQNDGCIEPPIVSRCASINCSQSDVRAYLEEDLRGIIDPKSKKDDYH